MKKSPRKSHPKPAITPALARTFAALPAKGQAIAVGLIAGLHDARHGGGLAIESLLTPAQRLAHAEIQTDWAARSAEHSQEAQERALATSIKWAEFGIPTIKERAQRVQRLVQLANAALNGVRDWSADDVRAIGEVLNDAWAELTYVVDLPESLANAPAPDEVDRDRIERARTGKLQAPIGAIEA
jgi:hypothetical protein